MASTRQPVGLPGLTTLAAILRPARLGDEAFGSRGQDRLEVDVLDELIDDGRVRSRF